MAPCTSDGNRTSIFAPPFFPPGRTSTRSLCTRTSLGEHSRCYSNQSFGISSSCQVNVNGSTAPEFAHPDAIRCIDQTGISKSVKQTAGVTRQRDRNHGRIKNGANDAACVINPSIRSRRPGQAVLYENRKPGMAPAKLFQ